MIIFAWGWFLFQRMNNPPKGAYEVKVVGKQWLWQFHYDHGLTTINDLYLPAEQRIKLTMTSDDVIHGFHLAEFRIKRDVIPGLYSTLWFEPQKPGVYTAYCTQYCGLSHSGMLAKVHILDAQDWEKWLTDSMKADDSSLSLVDLGKKVYNSNGCAGCHSIDGSALVGPSFKGIWGTKVEMTDGSKHLVDNDFIKQMIEYPNRLVVKGYPKGQMPSFKGILTEKQILAVAAFIKTLGESSQE